ARPPVAVLRRSLGERVRPTQARSFLRRSAHQNANSRRAFRLYAPFHRRLSPRAAPRRQDGQSSSAELTRNLFVTSECMHHVLKAADIRPTPDYEGRASQYARCSLVNQSVGSVHTGFGLCEMAAGGRQDLHVHSYEESFYVLEGAPTLVL